MTAGQGGSEACEGSLLALAGQFYSQGIMRSRLGRVAVLRRIPVRPLCEPWASTSGGKSNRVDMNDLQVKLAKHL